MNKTQLLGVSDGYTHVFSPLPVTSLTDPFKAICGANLPIRVACKTLYENRQADITCSTCSAKYKPSGEEPVRPPKFFPNQRKSSGPAVQGNLF